ncbi:MAG: hypothetical protein WAU91_13255 [Desulfatitalea sp.]
MQPIVKTAFALFLLVLLPLPSGWADEVVMNTGERFTTSRVWEEGGKIRFNMQGLVVSVNKEEVAAVVRGAGVQPPAAQSDPVPHPKPTPEISKLDTTVHPPKANTPAAPETQPLPLPHSTNGAGQSSPPAAHKATISGTGLEGVSWRMPPTALPGIEKVKTDPAYGGVEQYWRPGQGLQFGAAALDGWIYGFWQEQLYTIIMWANGRIGYDRMKREIFARYGQGVQRRPEAERFVWDDDQSQRMLEFDDQLKTGIFVMRSSEVDMLIKERYPDR